MSIPDARETPNQKTRQIRRGKQKPSPEFDATMVGSKQTDQPLKPADATLPGGQTGLPVDQPWHQSAYHIEKELGRGGMGVVLLATQKSLGRRVAVKLLPMGLNNANDYQLRFQQEAQVVAQLQHPHIVQIVDYGEEDGRPFLVMEYCPGGSFADRLQNESLEPKQAARIIKTLARAVQHAHDRQIIHRDLKPSNVLLCGDDNAPLSECYPKIADFGLAKFLDHQDGNLTSASQILGTPSYMAPEQAMGETGAVGPGVDVYSLGAILYELLTGKAPFPSSNSVSTLRRIAAKPPKPPSELSDNIPDDLEAICLKCLRKSPQKRYASAEHLADDLRRFCDGEDVEAHIQPATPSIWARPTVIWSLAVGLTALLIGVILWDNLGPAGENSSPPPVRAKGNPQNPLGQPNAKKQNADNTIMLFPGIAEELQLDAKQARLWRETSLKIDKLAPIPGPGKLPNQRKNEIDAPLADFVRQLKPHQSKRLGEIQLQVEGPFALVHNAVVIEKLKITKAQQMRIGRHLEMFGLQPTRPDPATYQHPAFLPPPYVMDKVMSELEKSQRERFHEMMGEIFHVGSKF